MEVGEGVCRAMGLGRGAGTDVEHVVHTVL